MKRFIGLLCLLLAPAAWGTTTVTGKIQTLGTGNVTSGAFVRFWLRGCAGNQPRVNGTSVIGPTQGGVFFFDIAADASGNTSGTIYSTRDNAGTGNGDIECGGSKQAVWYGMQIFVAGKGGPEMPVHAKSGGSLDITQVTPITTNPVITSPTGDSTYLRLDAGNSPETGNVNFTGSNTFTSINNIQFCDNFVGSDASAKIQACINALPAAGGIADAHNLTDIGGTGSTTIDPAARSVTLLLGPYTYQIKQIVLRSNFHILGAGMGNTTSGPAPTILQACATCGATNTFVLGGALAVQHVLLDGFRLYATSGNTTQIGMNFAAQVNGGGLWYSTLRNLCVGACGPALPFFGNSAITFDGSAGGTPKALNQFIDVRAVQAFSGGGSSFALNILGANGQMVFDQVEFDGPGQSGGGTNVNIAGSAAGLYPYSISFNELTSQLNNLGVNLSGAVNITFYQSHHELLNGDYQIGTSFTNNTYGTTIEATEFTSTGINAGNGFIVKDTAGAANTNLNFINNRIGNTPDAVLVGFTTNVYECGTLAGTGTYRPCQILNVTQLSAGTSPAGMPAGDLSAARSATIGNLSLGSDGLGAVFRSGNFMTLGIPAGGSIINNAGTGYQYNEGAAVSGGAGSDNCYADSTAHAIKCSYNGGSFFNQSQSIAAGTATMTTALIGTLACGTTVTVAATGVGTTDAISWAFSTAPGANPAELVVSAWPTPNNVNFQYCNSTAAGVTPTAATLNWRVVR